jgi:hypothetical protein
LTAGLFFTVILIFSESEKHIAATISVATFVWGIIWYNDFSWNFGLTIGLIAAYVATGAGYSFIKWFSHINKRSEEYGDLKVKWAKKNKGATADPITEKTNMLQALSVTQYGQFREFLSFEGFVGMYSDKGIIPSWRDNKSKLFAWVMYWPTSMFWTFLNDPLVRFGKWVVRRLGNWYDKMANRVFAKVGVDTNEDQLWQEKKAEEDARVKQEEEERAKKLLMEQKEKGILPTPLKPHADGRSRFE